MGEKLQIRIKGNEEWENVRRIVEEKPLADGSLGGTPRSYEINDGTQVAVNAPFIKKRRVFGE